MRRIEQRQGPETSVWPKPLSPQQPPISATPIGITKIICITLALLLVQWPCHANSDLTGQRKLYQQAQKSLARRDMNAYQNQIRQLGDYPLVAYLEYNRMSSQINQISDREINAFIDLHQGDYLGNLMQWHQLRKLARQGDWLTLDRLPDGYFTDTDTRCLKLNARYQLGEQQASLAAFDSLWMSASPLPSECTRMEALWRSAGMLTEKKLWKRMARAMQNDNRQLVQSLANSLPLAQRRQVQDALKYTQHPELFRVGASHRGLRKLQAYALIHGLKSLASLKPEKAEAGVHTLRNLGATPEAHHEELYRAIALGYTTLSDAKAIDWLQRADPQNQLGDLLDLRLHLALRNQRWAMLVDGIPQLPPHLQSQAKWLYWRARAQELTDAQPKASTLRSASLYRQAARLRDYYGFLAADRLGADYAFNDRSKAVSQDHLLAVSRIPGIRRSLEFRALGEQTQAQREWYNATKSLNPEFGAAAALFASQNGWHALSIYTLSGPALRDNVAQRFPVVYRDHYEAAGKRLNMDPNWLLAVSRQESAFAHDVRSRAGAVGLMQLMPATAKETARKAGLVFSPAHLTNPAQNITLGSTYLTHLNQRYGGNRVLATAAYNAGPGNVNRWLAQRGTLMDFDVWVETIPFRETRNYVQNVLTFSAIYAYRRGEHARISELVSWSSPQSNSASARGG